MPDNDQARRSNRPERPSPKLQPRTGIVRGCFSFAAGTTIALRQAHPGGGVPLVILSGKVAARMVIEDEGRN